MAEADSRMADDILQRMRSIRAKMDTKMTRVVNNAQKLVDWRYYFNKSPWVGLCAAAAAGYLVVRPRTKPLFVDSSIREALSGNGRLMAKPKQQTLVQTVSGLLIGMAVRAGVNYGSRWLGSFVRRDAVPTHSYTEVKS